MNNLLKYIIAFSLILFGGQLFAQQTLKAYQDTAALNNPGIQALFKQYESVMQKVPQIGTLPDPKLGLGYFVNPVETRVGPQQATFSISQSFPWFGQLDAQKGAVTERAFAVLEKFNNEKAKLNYEVAATYNDLYVLRSAITITGENIDLLQTFRDLARVKFEAGNGSMVDVLRVEMELDELENRLAFLDDTKRPITTRFEQLLNTKMITEITFPKVLWKDSLSMNKKEISDSVQTFNPSLLGLKHELLSYDKEITAAKKIGSPSFTLGLNYTAIGEKTGYTGNDNGRDALLPTVGVRIPLYRQKYEALIKESELAQESVSLRKVDKSNELMTTLENGFRDYDDAVRRVGLYEQLKDYAKQAMDILVAEYTSADADFEELIRMDRKLLKYELELEKARADQNTAVAYINFLMGK